jgi:nitrogen fixation protein
MSYDIEHEVINLIKKRGWGGKRCLQDFGWEVQGEETTGET